MAARLWPGVSAGICRDSETVVPVLTSAAARRRVSGVIRFRAPRSSSLPHRPQFDSFVIHSSNCAFVTLPVFAAADPEGCDDCAACPTTTQTPERRDGGESREDQSWSQTAACIDRTRKKSDPRMGSDFDMKARSTIEELFPGCFVTECALPARLRSRHASIAADCRHAHPGRGNRSSPADGTERRVALLRRRCRQHEVFAARSDHAAPTSSSLQVAWRWSSPDNDIVKANPAARPGAYQDTPLMVNGVLYTDDLARHLSSPSIPRPAGRSGSTTRRSGRSAGRRISASRIAAWPTGRDGTTKRIISGTHDAHLVSLDAETGKPDPAFGVERPRRCHRRACRTPSACATTRSTPRRSSSKNVIIAGSNITDGPQVKEQPRGDIFGFDVRTGKKLWTFHSVPQPGEFGNDTWEDDSADYTGNTNVWSMITVDEELGYVYLPFGTPTNDYYGGHRPGDNLFAESLVCLDATTGKRVWHFQAVHHGLWDYDFPAAPILVDITVDGRRIKAVAQVSKQGSSTCSIADRRAGVADRGAAGAAVDRAGRAHVADAAVSDQAAGVRSTGLHRRRSDRLHAGAESAGARGLEAVRSRSAVHAAVRAGHGAAARQRRRRGLGRRGVDPETGMLYVPSLTSPIIDAAREGRSGARQHARIGAAALQNLPTLDGLPLYKPPYSRVTAIRPEHRHDRVAGADRRRSAQSSAAEGSESRPARQRRRAAVRW